MQRSQAWANQFATRRRTPLAGGSKSGVDTWLSSLLPGAEPRRQSSAEQHSCHSRIDCAADAKQGANRGQSCVCCSVVSLVFAVVKLVSFNHWRDTMAWPVRLHQVWPLLPPLELVFNGNCCHVSPSLDQRDHSAATI